MGAPPPPPPPFASPHRLREPQGYSGCGVQRAPCPAQAPWWVPDLFLGETHGESSLPAPHLLPPGQAGPAAARRCSPVRAAAREAALHPLHLFLPFPISCPAFPGAAVFLQALMWKDIYEKNLGGSKKRGGRRDCAGARSGGSPCPARQCPAGQSDVGSTMPQKRVPPLPCPSQEDVLRCPLLWGHGQERREGPWVPCTEFLLHPSPPSSSSFPLFQTPHGAGLCFTPPPLLALSLL